MKLFLKILLFIFAMLITTVGEAKSLTVETSTFNTTFQFEEGTVTRTGSNVAWHDPGQSYSTWSAMDNYRSAHPGSNSGSNIVLGERGIIYTPVNVGDFILAGMAVKGLISAGMSIFGTRAVDAAAHVVARDGMQSAAISGINFTPKIVKQMGSRGWTDKLINSTVNNPYTTRAATNKATGNAATAFFTKDGAYIVRDNVTKEIIQISNRLDLRWIPDETIVNPYIP